MSFNMHRHLQNIGQLPRAPFDWIEVRLTSTLSISPVPYLIDFFASSQIDIAHLGSVQLRCCSQLPAHGPCGEYQGG